MSTIAKSQVEQLSTTVSQAEHHRASAKGQQINIEFNQIKDLFLGTLYPSGRSAGLSEEFLEVKQTVTQKEYHFQNYPEYELMAVGFLGLARIYLVAATSAFNQEKIDLVDVVAAFADYQKVFMGLEYLKRAPFTIHHGAIDWLGEYTQDLAKYQFSLGMPEEAEQLLKVEIARLENECFTLKDQPTSSNELAGKLSALGVAYARRGELFGTLSDIIHGYYVVLEADQLVANSGRVVDLSKMLLREAVKQASKSSPLVVVKAAMLGAFGFINAKVKK